MGLVDAEGNSLPGVRPDAQRIRETPEGKKVDVKEIRSESQSFDEMDLRTGETMTVGFWVARPRAAAKPTAMGVGRCGRFRHAHRSVRCAHFALGRAPPILDSYSFAGPKGREDA
jgi:hypothetical protein